MQIEEDILTMSYPRRYIEQIITGLEDPINEHLIKLVAFDFPPETRQHFRRELTIWLDKVQRLRMKPSRRTGSTKFYYDLLFDFPFGGTEVENARAIMDAVSRNCAGQVAIKTPEEVAEWLQQFHARLAQRLHDGQTVLDLIPP
jgi:hypothetical protein